MLKVNLDYKISIKYLIIFCCFLIVSSLEKTIYPYSISIYAVAILEGSSYIVTPILYIISLLCLGKVEYIVSMLFSIFIISFANFLYKKFNIKPVKEIPFFVFISMIFFIFLLDNKFTFCLDKDIIIKRVQVSLLSSLLSFTFSLSLEAVIEKGLKYKMNYTELIFIGCSIIVFGIGICNLISPYLYKGLAILTILFIAYIFRLGVCSIVSMALSLPLAIYFGNINFISTFFIYSLALEIVGKFNRHISSILLLPIEYSFYYVFNIYGGIFLEDFLPTLIPAILFLMIPTKPLQILKEKLSNFREKELIRQSINRNRIMLSNRLYELSNVFNEMGEAFFSFKKEQLNKDNVKDKLVGEIKKVCSSCENNECCQIDRREIEKDICKMLDIGLAKGKLSFIDLPKSLSNSCSKPNNIIYLSNKLISQFKQYTVNYKSISDGRDIIALESQGVSQMLKDLAFECGSILTYQGQKERALNNELYRRGFFASEILIYGEKENLSVSMVLSKKEFSLNEVYLALKVALKVDMVLCEKNVISQEKSYFLFKERSKYDAVFGLSFAVKDGSTKSGDTHSILRIKDNNFLVAIGDGMGSGEKAQNISQISLSLIESFYKSGLNSTLILNTVNKLLSFSEEDDFTALDVISINLKTLTVDFIKYGSPYSFIVSKKGIKIVEGNTLPLGIISEIKPSVCQTEILDNDIIILLTDGIIDSFKDSSTIIDFIRTLPAKNPQTLCDSILNRAIENSGGIKKDDMTVLAVRVFSR